MSTTAERVAQMVDMLPDDEQVFAYEFVQRLVFAWDPDFTKVTPVEAAALRKADEEYERGDTVKHSEINWE